MAGFNEADDEAQEFVGTLDLETRDGVQWDEGAAGASSSTPAATLPSIFAPSSATLAAPQSSVDSRPLPAVTSLPHTSAVSPPPLAQLAVLTEPSLSSVSRNTPRRSPRFIEDEFSRLAVGDVPQAEKAGDDPSTPPDPRNVEAAEYQTPTALSRLLGAELMTTPDHSRASSYSLGNPNLVSRNPNTDYASLSEHLYTRGLLSGRHSDISIIAFNHRYNLHRLILDRAPFFTAALSEPWLESTSKEVLLRPEDSDSNISQTAFELALKHLYGCNITAETEVDPFGVFATGSWLEMHDLVDSSINAILRQMSPETLAPLINTLTTHYYSRPGERILASAKAMLCREGWEMPLKSWDEIPGEIIRELVGGDGFYVRGEWERWILAKRLLDRRLKQRAVECGLVDANSPNKVRAPDTLGLMSIRFDTPYRMNAMTTRRSGPANQHDKWISLYTHPDVEPLLVLLDEGIHYAHLEFEQLQFIRQAKDIFGLPLLPDVVVTNALWMQMELRQRVVNAKEGDLELGLSQPAEPAREPEQAPGSKPASGKRKLSDVVDADVKTGNRDGYCGSGSWDATGRPRKFWIPSTDCNIVMGGNSEPVVTTNPNSANPNSAILRHVSRMSASIDPPDVQWATDFAASPATNLEGVNRPNTPGRPSSSSGIHPRPVAYTTFPPFRFAVEFDNPRTMKEKKRSYSRTVFYAGSFWNIYIQKLRSQKNSQLGVYLHRAKERDADGVNYPGSSVDERIFSLEQEIILRSERRGKVRIGPRRSSNLDKRSGASALDVPSAGPEGENDTIRSGYRRRNPLHNAATLESHATLDSDTDDSASPTWENDIYGTTPPALRQSSRAHPNPNAQPRSASSNAAALLLPKHHTPALPPYTDPRPTIKTYFKIYSPSKGGRLLSVYESAPDKFDFSQSWGWRSSTLLLDEVFLAVDTPESAAAGGAGEQTEGASEGATEAQQSGDDASVKEREREREREARRRLRFMIVIGNL